MPISGVKGSPEVESQSETGSWPENIWKWLTRSLGLRVILGRRNVKCCFPNNWHVKPGGTDWVGQYSARSFWKQAGCWKKTNCLEIQMFLKRGMLRLCWIQCLFSLYPALSWKATLVIIHFLHRGDKCTSWGKNSCFDISGWETCPWHMHRPWYTVPWHRVLAAVWEAGTVPAQRQWHASSAVEQVPSGDVCTGKAAEPRKCSLCHRSVLCASRGTTHLLTCGNVFMLGKATTGQEKKKLSLCCVVAASSHKLHCGRKLSVRSNSFQASSRSGSLDL